MTTGPSRRAVVSAALLALPAAACTQSPLSSADPGARLVEAARRQVGVTLVYDPVYHRIPYPGGDVGRVLGVCADVVVRAGRDAWGADLQRLVHEDMAADFDAYPSRRAWGLNHPDTNIDHRRVLNLETYWTRRGERLWTAPPRTAGDRFPATIAAGDLLTWRDAEGRPHIGIAAGAGRQPKIIHNIGWGARIVPISDLARLHAAAHFRWRI